jgi:hypothetical protein
VFLSILFIACVTYSRLILLESVHDDWLSLFSLFRYEWLLQLCHQLHDAVITVRVPVARSCMWYLLIPYHSQKHQFTYWVFPKLVFGDKVQLTCNRCLNACNSASSVHSSASVSLLKCRCNHIIIWIIALFIDPFLHVSVFLEWSSQLSFIFQLYSHQVWTLAFREVLPIDYNEHLILGLLCWKGSLVWLQVCISSSRLISRLSILDETSTKASYLYWLILDQMRKRLSHSLFKT